MIRPVDFTATVISNEFLTKDVKEIKFNYDGSEFIAGQFFMLKFPNPENPSEILQRAYSVASAPGIKTFIFCYDVIENGKGSTYLANLIPGQTVNFKGPFGLCYPKADDVNDFLFVATGTGIAPLKSMLEDLANKNPNKKIDLFFGVRFEEDIFYKFELQDLKSRLPNLSVNFSITRPDENWSGLTGRVTEHLKNCDLSHNPSVYICGLGAMIKDVRDLLIARGLDKGNIHVEIHDTI